MFLIIKTDDSISILFYLIVIVFSWNNLILQDIIDFSSGEYGFRQ